MPLDAARNPFDDIGPAEIAPLPPDHPLRQPLPCPDRAAQDASPEPATVIDSASLHVGG